MQINTSITDRKLVRVTIENELLNIGFELPVSATRWLGQKLIDRADEIMPLAAVHETSRTVHETASGKTLPLLNLTDGRFEYSGRLWEDDAKKILDALSIETLAFAEMTGLGLPVEELPGLADAGMIMLVSGRGEANAGDYALTDDGIRMLVDWDLDAANAALAGGG